MNMIERNNPYKYINSESLKNVSKNAKKIALSVGLITMGLTFTGCGRDIKEKLTLVENNNIPENTIVYVIDDEKFCVNENDIIKFSNKVLKEKFGKEASYYDLTLEKSLSIEELDYTEELVYFKNIERLEISKSSVKDISVLKDLPNLKELVIRDCDKLSDISVLKETNIESLRISNLSNLEDFSFIKEMKNLKKLSIYNCENCHINQDVLKGLNLTELNLYFIDIQDLSNISEMKNLEKIKVEGCNLKSIEELKDLNKLIHVNISDCLVSDVSALYGLTNLTELNLSNNSIDNFDITKFTNLESINIKSNYALYTEEILEYCENNNISIDINKEEVECVNQIKDIISKMELEGLSTAQKEGKIYSYILEHIRYDEEALENDGLAQEYNEKSLYYALQGKGVCANYAALFDAMCDVAGINAYHVSGYGKTSFLSGGPHGWNLIEIDGQYMLCDPTWSDSIRDTAEYKVLNIFKDNEDLKDEYYNVSGASAEKFIKNHKENIYENKNVQSPRSDETLSQPEEVISLTVTKENGKEINGKVLAGIATGSVVLVAGGAILHHQRQQMLRRKKRERERKARLAEERNNFYTTSYGRY